MDSFTDLSPGDLIVHEHHGIGRFVGLVKMQVDGVQKDYIKLAYAGTDTLYLPATQLDSISKYIGGGDDPETKKLSKLGGTDWERAKSRTRAAVHFSSSPRARERAADTPNRSLTWGAKGRTSSSRAARVVSSCSVSAERASSAAWRRPAAASAAAHFSR